MKGVVVDSTGYVDHLGREEEFVDYETYFFGETEEGAFLCICFCFCVHG